MDLAPLTPESNDVEWLESISDLDSSLYSEFSDRIVIDKRLTRQLVSNQANKTQPFYRWFKYKEAFSADLVGYLFDQYKPISGTVLDPFSGAGTGLFATNDLGYASEGIELLDIGQKIAEANLALRRGNVEQIVEGLESWCEKKPWNKKGRKEDFNELRITKGAYSDETANRLRRFLFEAKKELDPCQSILRFALLCILESISFTRKDGQYLRWDYRSNRSSGKSRFDKGAILGFDEAITGKLRQIIDDLTNEPSPTLFNDFGTAEKSKSLRLISGSCLDVTPTLPARRYSSIITSPPYCNRYDYTRTYALELALLGKTEEQMVALRQAMLSCTVENKSKQLVSMNPKWKVPIKICDDFPLLQQILKYLDAKKIKKELNNSGIARMVRGYFYEMACIIGESFRVLKKGGYLFMVNDNVRYAGASISVDLILSKVAEELGFTVQNILVLPQGKGNSSQQMGHHGRDALRKCVYVWKKER